MILLNPEFQRNIWLKFSPFRLIAMPLLLGILIFATAYFNTDWADDVSSLGLSVYYITVILWGTYEAGQSFQDEVRNNTWDFQKMSQVTPRQLTLGKLLGATSYTWYYGLTALAVYGFCQLTGGSTNAGFSVLSLLLSGLIGHAASTLVSGLHVSRAMEKTTGIMRKNAGTVVAFLVGFIASQAALSVSNFDVFSQKQRNISGLIDWYGGAFDRTDFVLLSLCFFLFWLIMGAYRIIREELLYKVTPVWWTAFICTLMVYFSGFDTTFDTPMEKIQFSYFFVLGLTYVTAFLEAGDLARYQRFFLAQKRKQAREAFINMPKWVASSFVLLALYLTLLIDNAAHGGNESAEKFNLFTSLALFAARDILFVHLALHVFRIRHVRFTLLFYYLMAYWLLPLLHAKLLGVRFDGFFEKAMGFSTWYYPSISGSVATALFPVTLQIAGLCLIALYVHRHRKKQAAP